MFDAYFPGIKYAHKTNACCFLQKLYDATELTRIRALKTYIFSRNSHGSITIAHRNQVLVQWRRLEFVQTYGLVNNNRHAVLR